jgi:hypothetical protein
MALLLIPAAWIAAAAFIVVLCITASRSDEALAMAEEPAYARTSFGELVVWERAPLVAARIGPQGARRARAPRA